MAAAAPLLEVGRARDGIADEDIQRRSGTRRRSPLPCDLRGDAVDVLGDRAGVLSRDPDGRHRALAVRDDRPDQLAGLIVEHRIGSQEVGAALIAAAQIGTMTHTAVDTVQPSTARDQRRITGGSQLCRERRGRVSTLRRRRALRCGIDDHGEREQRGSGRKD